MRTDDFYYDLPEELIAQEPADPRDSCRLLVLRRSDASIEHRSFRDIGDQLRPGDLLVVNETRVLPARLTGVKMPGGAHVEILLLKDKGQDVWECLVRPGRRLKPGTVVSFGDGLLEASILDVVEGSGARSVRFETREGSFMDAVHRLGEMPLPPYITKRLADPELYQTVFSRDEHSAAAPTAGLHFTRELLDRLSGSGIAIASVELDVGLDTFRPVTEDDPTRHHIHTEHFRVPAETAEAVNACRDRGGRVVAVGTTSVRALESAFDRSSGRVVPVDGQTSLFILPGYRFGAVDALVTNFHVPRSTLLMMISAFAGRDAVMDAYSRAVKERYRFLSFGDAMLIL